jgi:Bacterial regulatory protein, Fis family
MSEPEEIQELIRLLDPRLANDQTDLYRRALEQFDRVILRRALERCEGNLTRAAAMLGLSRVTLRSKLRALGLSTGKGNSTEMPAGNPNHAHTHTEHPPQSPPHLPQAQSPQREGGQELTRQDRPGAGFSEPNAVDTARREAAGFHNLR